jgi:hypothetical protein
MTLSCAANTLSPPVKFQSANKPIGANVQSRFDLQHLMGTDCNKSILDGRARRKTGYAKFAASRP